jgi:hypothetical protein
MTRPNEATTASTLASLRWPLSPTAACMQLHRLYCHFVPWHYLLHAACRRPSNVANSRVIHNQVCPFCELWSISCVLSHSAQCLASNRSSKKVQSPHFASPDCFRQDIPIANSANAVFSRAQPHLAAFYSWSRQDTTRCWIERRCCLPIRRKMTRWIRQNRRRGIGNGRPMLIPLQSTFDKTRAFYSFLTLPTKEKRMSNR